MASSNILANKVLQLECILKQKDTEINKLKKELEIACRVPDCALTAKEALQKPAKAKRKAPMKKCSKCGAEVFAMHHKRHEAKCDGVVK